MTTIVEKFKETYDASKIPYTQTIVEEIAQLENPVLNKLLYNNLYGTRLNINYISGPVQLEILTFEDTTFYLFGDNHGSPDICPKTPHTSAMVIDIADYLVYVVPNTNKFLDIYNETLIYEIDNYHNTSDKTCSLVNIDFKLRNCKMKSCPLIRYHNMDIRQPDFSFYDIPADIIYSYNPLLNTTYSGNIVSFLTAIANTSDLNTIVTDLLEEFNKSFLFTKYKKSTHYVIIIAFITQQLLEYITTIKTIVAQNTTIHIYVNDPVFHSILLIINRITSTFMDTYMLGRMLKNFKSNGKQPRKPYNIISYAGVAHNQTYIKFFNQNGATPIYRSGTFYNDDISIKEEIGITIHESIKRGSCLNIINSNLPCTEQQSNTQLPTDISIQKNSIFDKQIIDNMICDVCEYNRQRKILKKKILGHAPAVSDVPAVPEHIDEGVEETKDGGQSGFGSYPKGGIIQLKQCRKSINRKDISRKSINRKDISRKSINKKSINKKKSRKDISRKSISRKSINKKKSRKDISRKSINKKSINKKKVEKI